MSKKPDDHDRRLFAISQRRDRFDLFRDGWNERDWRVHNELLKQRLLTQRLDGVPDVVPPNLPVSFSLHDTREQRERQRRRDANRVLGRYGLGPYRW